ncbi:MAG TPA: GTPase HflX [Acidimicrobiales bacterium]|nr:GTPase HflX [Acidimicrobiales bacterium]
MTLIERRFRERIVLVGVASRPRTLGEVEASLDELALLVDTAGADEAARVVQARDTLDAATYIGRGKAEELHALCEAVDADTVVFDDELSPAQQRNLERIIGRTAIDRTAVILDIFAQNARTEEGRAQVELALLQYRLPRLRGKGVTLSQQAGGIGTRGPGETQLEVDRRRLQQRIQRLEVVLANLEATRKTQRRRRRRGARRTVSLVGYTNTGKSTLLNALTDADVLVENRLFATLDPRTRRLELPGGETVLCSDTVGFVRKLPHQLVTAFHSTLETVADSDLLVHVVDAAAPDPDAQIAAVRSVLAEIGADSVPELFTFNKSDLAPVSAGRLHRQHPDSVVCSAVTGQGLDGLLHAIAEALRVRDRTVELSVPYERGDVIAALHRDGEVLDQRDSGSGLAVRARLDEAGRRRFSQFTVAKASRGDGDGSVGGGPS